MCDPAETDFPQDWHIEAPTRILHVGFVRRLRGETHLPEYDQCQVGEDSLIHKLDT
jgi:hypothetical protein